MAPGVEFRGVLEAKRPAGSSRKSSRRSPARATRHKAGAERKSELASQKAGYRKASPASHTRSHSAREPPADVESAAALARGSLTRYDSIVRPSRLRAGAGGERSVPGDRRCGR